MPGSKRPSRKRVNKGTKRASPGTAPKSRRSTAAAPDSGPKVQWAYGASVAIGKALKVFTQKITRKLKGGTVTRNATPANPALLVKSDKGGKALKSASELKVRRKTSK